MFNVKSRLAKLELDHVKALQNDVETREAFETRLGQIAALKLILAGSTPEAIIAKSQRIIARYPGIPYLYRAMISIAQEYQ